jgi:hypothetical protein
MSERQPDPERMSHRGEDDPEVEGHLRAAQPAERAAARGGDDPEVEGHVMNFEPPEKSAPREEDEPDEGEGRHAF